jgi:fructose-1-phosphate kinase PfkB-like protein
MAAILTLTMNRALDIATATDALSDDQIARLDDVERLYTQMSVGDSATR